MGALAGRTAVVTGGSRGIGRAVVRRLAADGAAVLFSYRARADAADEVVGAVASDGGRARAVAADVRCPSDLDELFAAAAYFAELGHDGLDVLVNNAGIFESTPLLEITEGRWNEVMDTNAKSVLLAMQKAAGLLNDGGRIINVSSIGTRWPSPGESLYAAAKAAVEQLTRVASRELGSRGITVNAVSPGPTDTDLLRAAVPPEALAGVAQMTALDRVGRPDDVAGVVAFLATDDARWLTGQVITCDGGLV